MSHSEVNRSSSNTIVLACICTLAMLMAQNLQAEAGFSFKEVKDKYLDVLLDGKAVVRYMTENAPVVDPKSLTATNKPFLHVFNAQGTALISNHGDQGEFPHHRGIMIGWTRVTYKGEKYNFWGMFNNAQVHRAFAKRAVDEESAVFVSEVEWITHGGDTVLTEERTVTVRRAAAPAYVMIDVDSTIKAGDADLYLDGDPEHGGVQFRAADAMDRATGKFAYPGADVSARDLIDPPWVACQFALDGRTFSVLQIDNPANPRGARISAYRDYCRFGYFPQPFNLRAGDTYTLRYRFVVAEGEIMATEAVQDACNAYTGGNQDLGPVTRRAAEGKPAPRKKR